MPDQPPPSPDSTSSQTHHKRGPWSTAEDSLLMRLVGDGFPLNWVKISDALATRSPKQCRERYHQNLKPSLNHEAITAQEGLLIEELVRLKGKRWAEIARSLEGRSDNAVKNWWNGNQNRRRRHDKRRNIASTQSSPHHADDYPAPYLRFPCSLPPVGMDPHPGHGYPYGEQHFPLQHHHHRHHQWMHAASPSQQQHRPDTAQEERYSQSHNCTHQPQPRSSPYNHHPLLPCYREHTQRQCDPHTRDSPALPESSREAGPSGYPYYHHHYNSPYASAHQYTARHEGDLGDQRHSLQYQSNELLPSPTSRDSRSPREELLDAESAYNSRGGQPYPISPHPLPPLSVQLPPIHFAGNERQAQRRHDDVTVEAGRQEGSGLPPFDTLLRHGNRTPGDTGTHKRTLSAASTDSNRHLQLLTAPTTPAGSTAQPSGGPQPAATADAAGSGDIKSTKSKMNINHMLD